MSSDKTIKITREWAMPSRHTFTIKPIKELISRYMDEYGGVWVDPFAGFNSPAHITNDLNPKAPTDYHIDALAFAKASPDFSHVFFDPPYSPRQISECYKSVGLKVGMEGTQSSFYSKIKDEIAVKQKKNGMVLSFGWNTQGFGRNRGYEIIEILLVAHGGAHNDTLVTVERKIKE